LRVARPWVGLVREAPHGHCGLEPWVNYAWLEVDEMPGGRSAPRCGHRRGEECDTMAAFGNESVKEQEILG